MDSTTNIAKGALSKEKGLGKEAVKFDADAIKDVHDAYKLQHTQIKRVKFATMDSPPISPFLEQRNTWNDLETTDRRLWKRRRDLVIRQNYLGSQWLQLGQREKALRENFISFSKFLKTNLEKRERAFRKIQNDTETVHNRTVEIDQLKCRYDCRRQEFLTMKREIQKHSIYERFLEKVIYLASGEFKTIEDLPKRMEVLLLAKERLQTIQADQLNRFEKSKKVMGQFMESEILQIIGLNNTIAALQYKYDDAINRTIELDNMVVNLKTTILKYSTDLSSNKDCIENLYNQICLKHRIIEKYRKKGLINQLLEINHSMVGYGKIYSLMRKKSKRESRVEKIEKR
ncbi:coiled-coil domain-containing protein 42 like-2-like [Harmonia axyridis]|uniref:coiled-coil domain-containing protein 42 like-2-like n=1 Tax=Harmonia axyridis TaxID=115357 RepID=UPI001E2789C0|nr:coiled-coil domain-containing protein 42 like-2-like [Harmonia axyridis]